MATKKDLKALGARRTQSKIAKTEETMMPLASLKLDLGCGKNKKDGFIGIDTRDFGKTDWYSDLGAPGHWIMHAKDAPVGSKIVPPGQMYALSSQLPPEVARMKKFALADESVAEAHCSHFLEHLTWPERVNFLNELYRVLVPGGTCFIVLPHWASMRYYGDPTHKEPMSEFAFYYLDSNWRKDNAPHSGYTCHFNVSWGYGIHPEYQTKAPEVQQFALKWYRDAATDIVGTMTKGPMTAA